MKKLLIFIPLLIFCFTSCNDENDLTEDENVAKLIESIQENSALLDSALDRTTALLKDGKIIKRNIEEADNKEEFIVQMNSAIGSIFDQTIAHLTIKKQTPSLTKLRQDVLLAYIITSKDHLDTYAAKVRSNAEARKGKGDQIEVLSYSWLAVSSPPIEQVSLNYTKISYILEVYELIMKYQQPVDLDNSIDLHIKSNEEIRVAIGLLLPAIQAAREAPRSHNTLMKIVLASSVFDNKLPDNMPELLQQQQAAAFLGGVDLLISEAFDHTNEKTVSTDVLRVIYENFMTELWSQTWDHKYN